MQKQVIIAAILLIGLASSLRIAPIPQHLSKGNSTFEIGNISSLNFEFKAPQKSADKQSQSELLAHQTQREHDLRKFRQIGEELFSERISKLKVNTPKKGLKGQNLVVKVTLNNTNTKYTNYDNYAVDEAYEISINQNLTVIEFKCHGYVSFLRALETFTQTLIHSFKKTHFSFDFLPLQIKDAPAFGHRGVMIDTSRHFLSLEQIKKTIRGLSISKFNVLHLHLTDSESFPLELKKNPEITAYGAYSSDEVYTQKQLKELDAFAQKYGIILIPEIDSPAHTRSWSNAPNLHDIDSCRDYPKEQWGFYCNEPPCGQLDVTLQKAHDITEDIMIETSEVFSSEFLHLGGDEPNKKCWESKPSIAAYMKEHGIKDYNELQSYFRDFQKSVIEKNNLNKKRIFWLASNNVDVKTDDSAIMQFWGDLSEYTYMQKINNPIILSTYTYVYLDCGLGNSLGDDSWCDPFKTWKRIYSLDVLANGAISRDRILGGELALWTETSHTDDFVQKIFPRAVALNFNLWNPESKLGEVELVKHLIAIQTSIRLAGIPTGVVSSQFCELNVEYCFFD